MTSPWAAPTGAITSLSGPDARGTATAAAPARPLVGRGGDVGSRARGDVRNSRGAVRGGTQHEHAGACYPGFAADTDGPTAAIQRRRPGGR
jgi:hypothetical protein